MNIELLKNKRNKLKEECVDIINEFLEKDWSYSKIAKFFGVSNGQVSKFCKSRNLLSKKTKRTLILQKLREEGKFQCRVCNLIFNIDDRVIRYNDYICSDCVPADRLRHAKSLGLEQHISKKLLAAKIKCRHLNREFNLVKQDILNLWNKQNGKCYYSGLEMSVMHDDPMIFSIDRIESSKGYTKDNIVLCCLTFNVMKLDFSKTDFIKYCKIIAENN